MHISENQLLETLTPLFTGEIESVRILPAKTVTLPKRELYNLPEVFTVEPFTFMVNQEKFAGFVLDFMLESFAKPSDPYFVEEEYAEIVDLIKNQVGLSNAIVINPVEGSDQVVEGIPCGSGDCFIFELQTKRPQQKAEVF